MQAKVGTLLIRLNHALQEIYRKLYFLTRERNEGKKKKTDTGYLRWMTQEINLSPDNCF